MNCLAERPRDASRAALFLYRRRTQTLCQCEDQWIPQHLASLDVLEAFLLIAHAGLDDIIHILVVYIVRCDLSVCDRHIS